MDQDSTESDPFYDFFYSVQERCLFPNENQNAY